MIIRKTINLKVNNLDKQTYLSLFESCNNVFNDYAKWSFENNTLNKNKAHKALFFPLQEKYPTVKTALQQAARDSALACCKTQKLKGKIPFKKSLSMRLNVLCYTIRGEQLTLINPQKRHQEILHIPDYYKDIFQTWKTKDAVLSYDKKKKQFWIHITMQKPEEVTIIKTSKNVLGIDRGIYNVATCSDGSLFGSKNVIRVKNNYIHLRRQLQKKGTRSAKRKLKTISGKEKRFVSNTNHIISKQIVNKPYDIFVLENLKGIKGKRKLKQNNRKIGGWSYYQLELFLTYKANFLGKKVVKVHPAYTSQTCSCCGQIDKENRTKNLFRCVCGNKMHADINAAVNIRNKFQRSVLQSNGAPVNEPNVSLAS